MTPMAQVLDRESCLDAFERLSPGFAGHGEDWLAARRRAAIAAFAERGLPTTRAEDWKYTDLRALTRRGYDFAARGGDAGDAAAPLAGLDAARLVFVNGRFEPRLSDDLNALPQGVRAQSLKPALAASDPVVKASLGAAAPDDGHGLSALNAAFVNDGLFVHLAAGARMQRLLEVVFVTADGERAPLSQPRNLVVLEPGAELNLLERHLGSGGHRYLNNPVTEILLADAARLEYCRLQEEADRSGHVGGLFARQRAASRFIATTVALDGMLIRNDVSVALDGADAECRLNGLTLADGRQHVDHHTQIHHNVGRCTSRELYKGVLDGRSRSVFHGRIVVARNAQHTDSEQRNQNLLLSRDAEIDTKPQLEIYADDVKCSHGATVGQLDEDAAFYLRTRGIDARAARAALTRAFAGAALREISEPAIRGHVERRIESRFDATGGA